MSTFNKIPWTLFIIIYMVVVHILEIDMAGVAGYVFLALCIVILFVEFFKSGDIKLLTFLVDIISSVGALIIATVLMSYLIFKEGKMPTFFDWFGVAIIVGDAILSPVNAFRTPLRNLEIGSGF